MASEKKERGRSACLHIQIFSAIPFKKKHLEADFKRLLLFFVQKFDLSCLRSERNHWNKRRNILCFAYFSCQMNRFSKHKKMNSNPSSRPSSQLVYTAVDDSMSVTEIICEYGDSDEAVSETVCEMEGTDLAQAHIYIEDPQSDGNARDPITNKEDTLNSNHTFKQEELYIDNADSPAFHEIFADDKKFKCGVCCQQFDDLQTISRHMELHSGEKKYECAECGKQFKNINNVMRHMVVHSGERKFTCPVCHKPFSQVGNLKRHLLTHSGEKRFPCKFCGRGFTQMNNLIRHQVIHSGQKNYECPLCHRLFNQISNLNRHMLIHKGIKMYKCEICGKAFSQLTNLQKHKERHTRGRKYVCIECGEGFDHKLLFNKHIVNHFGKPRYECKVCGRVVTQKSTLNQHMLLHFEEKQYSCQKCSKTYAQKGSLTKHMEAHNNIRHHCKVCNRYFYDEKGLWKHEASHTDKAKTIAGTSDKETKLTDYDLQFCDLCGKSFILKRSLRRHMVKEHNKVIEMKKTVTQGRYICGLCDKVFVHRKSLKKHSLKKHGVTIENNGSARAAMQSAKENEDTESAKENDAGLKTRVIASTVFTKADIADALLNIKQENVIEAAATLEDGESNNEDWQDFTYINVKEEHNPEEIMEASVHLCKICGRGYYLVNNLRKHLAQKHGVFSEELRDVLRETNSKSETIILSGTEQPGYLVSSESKTKSEKDKVDNSPTSIGDTSRIKTYRERKRRSGSTAANNCETCGDEFESSIELLLHMLKHSKEKKNDLLNVVNEVSQEFQGIKKLGADLTVVTKGLSSCFPSNRKKKRSSNKSIYLINKKSQEKTFLKSKSNDCTDKCNVESIVLEEGKEEKQKIIEIHAVVDDDEETEDEEVKEGADSDDEELVLRLEL
ncbi:hypothetical protein SK128_025577 [Halocaridina rubra]|uniref:C2H2-type domain-containing protein n=1 Tax=Halocaridina rubra TaxID=373956 RepID=A0AAN8X1F9_HALRR